ncbi:hypothetical protein [Phormidium tenue]|nr:hypothetical protein [Phormidium tenue]
MNKRLSVEQHPTPLAPNHAIALDSQPFFIQFSGQQSTAQPR